MANRIDVGKLTLEQTVDLFKELIDLLPEQALLETLSEALTAVQIVELYEGRKE